MYYITISNGLLKDGHRQRMGAAVWEFMWLLDKMTDKIDGKVLGGKPVQLKEISDNLASHEDTVCKNISKLRKEGYIKTRRTPYGMVVWVQKPKKFFQKDKERVGESSVSDDRESAETPIVRESAKTPITNKDSTAKDRTIHIATDVAGVEVNELMGVFYKTINPALDFKNKTQRRAAESLIRAVGKEKALVAAQYAISIQNQKYARAITKPTELKENYGWLQAHFSKKKNNGVFISS